MSLDGIFEGIQKLSKYIVCLDDLKLFKELPCFRGAGTRSVTEGFVTEQKKSLIRGLVTSVQKDQSIVSLTPEMKT